MTKQEYIKRRLQMLCAMCNRLHRIRVKLEEKLSDQGLLEEFDHIYQQVVEEEF